MFSTEGPLCKYQKVDGVLWFKLAAVYQGLSERGHHVLHQVVPQRKRASVQQLSLLSVQLRQILLLINDEIIELTISI